MKHNLRLNENVSSLFLLLFLFGLLACKSDFKVDDSSTFKVIDEPIFGNSRNIEEQEFDLENHLKAYTQLRNSIKEQRAKINTSNLSAQEKESQASTYISQILIDSIFQYWENTPWDFNGHTDNPREGEVACG